MKDNRIKQIFCMLLLSLMTPLFAADIYVDSTASGSDNGSDWTNAYDTLEEAITAAVASDTIHIAAGTYKPTDTTNGYTVDKALTILGGYPAGGGANDSRANPTILSGDINGDGTSYAEMLLKISAVVTIDGLTIKQTAKSGGNFDTAAVALELGSQGSTVSNCIIEENDHKWSSVFALRTGVANRDTPVIVENCLIRNNGAAANLTGGPYATHGTILMYATGGIQFNNCSFLENTIIHSPGANGGKFFHGGGGDDNLKATINNCTWSTSTLSSLLFRNSSNGAATIIILNSIINDEGISATTRLMSSDSVIFNTVLSEAVESSAGFTENKNVTDAGLGAKLSLTNNGGTTDTFTLSIFDSNIIESGISVYRDSDNTLYYQDGSATELLITDDSAYTSTAGTIITPAEDAEGTARTQGFETFDLGVSTYVTSGMTISNSTTAHTSTELISGTTAPIIRLEVNTLGEDNPYSLTDLVTTVTDANDAVNNLQIFSTGSDANFNTTTPIGTVSEAGTVVIPTPHTLISGVNYIWIAGNVSTNPALLTSVVDAEVTSITVDNGSSLADTPLITAPTGDLSVVLYLVDNGFEVEDYFDTNTDGTGAGFSNDDPVASPAVDSLGNTWTFGDLNNPGANTSVHYWTNFQSMGQHIQFYGPNQVTAAPGYFWEVAPGNIPSTSIPGEISFDATRGTSSNLDFVIEALDAGDNWVTIGTETNWNSSNVNRYSYYISDMSLFSKYRVRITANNDADGISRIHFNDVTIKNSAAISYTLTFVAGSNGTISGLNPQNASGASAPVEAIPDEGYVFGNWTDESDTEVGTDATLIIANPTADQTYTANFLIDTDGDGVADVNDDFPANPNRFANLDNGAGLTLYYDFDDLSTTTITDLSPNGYDSTLELLNGSLSTDFANDGAIDLSVAPQAYTVTGNITTKVKPAGRFETISFWHMSDIDVTTASPVEPLVSLTDGSNSDGAWNKITIGGPDGVRIARWDGGENWLAYATDISSGWNHFAFIWNGSYYDFYLNGVQQTDVTFNDSDNPPTVFANRTVDIGRASNTFSNDLFDEFRIFSRQLNAEEIDDLISRRSPTAFTVTFDPTSSGVITDGEAVQTITQNFDATEPTVTAIFGKIFTGWDSDFTNVQADITVTAQYIDATYTVTFSPGEHGFIDTGIPVQTITHGQDAIPPSILAYPGYTFSGLWDQPHTNITADVTITALYSENSNYTITFLPGSNGAITAGDSVQSVPEGASAIEPTITADNGWTFTGWDNYDWEAVQEDLTVTALYSPITYIITFNLGVNGTSSDQLVHTVPYFGNATPPAVTANEGWDFIEWDSTAYLNVENSAIINAVYAVSTYTVTFVISNNATYTGDLVQTIPHGSSAVAPIVTPNEGFEWDPATGWDTDYSNITRDTTVTAVLTNSLNPEPRYRLYNYNDGNHHWTTSLEEYEFLVEAGWIGEGFDHRVPTSQQAFGGIDSIPYWRLYNPNNGEHHYTGSEAEYDFVGSVGWIKEGFNCHIFPSQVGTTIPLHRIYNPNSGLHHFTTDHNEFTLLTTHGWINEGVSAYVFPASE